MRTAILIPARFASTRLPGKPLLRDTGKYLVQHVYEQARLAKCADTVIVATDDERIRSAVEGFGGRAVMTRADHVSGTDRIAEVAETLDAELLINLQGDEPTFDAGCIDQLAGLMCEADTDIGTLAVPIRDPEAYRNPNVVKVVRDDHGRALYFSRSPIPYYRDAVPTFDGSVLQHLGVYAYHREVLLRLARTPPHPLEQAEKLEQLRLLGTGGTIRVGVIAHAGRGVDTPEDYATFVRSCRLSRAA